MKNIFYFNLLLFLLAVIFVIGAGFLLVKTNQTNEVSAQVDGDEIPPVLSDIEISEVTATTSVITWNTSELADSLINYGLDKNYGIIRDPRFDKTSHKIILEDLLPDYKYYFRITSSDSEGNQGISSDYSFTTLKEEEEKIKEGYAEDVIDEGSGGLSEIILEEGAGGLSEQGMEKVLQMIENVSSEEQLEKIQEKVQQKAEEEVKPPTIILDYADVEVGIDYALISWATDKESNSMVALAEEGDYDEFAENPYAWKEGEPNETVLEHVVRVNGLSPATVYHFQVSSESELGLTGRSTDKTFKTKSILPEIYNVQVAKIEEEAATIKWMTNVPCSSIVEYTNLNTNESKLEGNSSFLTIHSMRLTDLIFDTYYSAVINVESEDGEKAEPVALTFITTRDEYPPVISKVNTESTLYPGSENKIQTIASWRTDEDAKCQLFYHQGLVAAGGEADSQQIEEEFGIKHVQVITNFSPSSVYKFWIECYDEAENLAKSEDFTMLTPGQEESIIDIIIKNFESSFGWLKGK